MSEDVSANELALMLKYLRERLETLEAIESNALELGFCPACFRDCIVVDDRCHRCDQLLKGSLSLPVTVHFLNTDRVAPWSPGDPGTPIGTVVAVDGDEVTIEVGGAAVDAFREVVD